MALDYIFIGMSAIIFILYLISLILLFRIRRKVTKEAGTAFLFLIIAVLLLGIRRVQQILMEGGINYTIPYFTDFTILTFALLFLLAIYNFYKMLGDTGKSYSGRKRYMKNYKESYFSKRRARRW